MLTDSSKENLKREIGVRSLTLSIINITVGTGIFVIPALLSESMGATAIIAYLVCGLLISLIALCFAEVGSKTSASGGVYAYIENAFGPYAGFMANNVYLLGSSVLSDAALANALADTMKYFFPSLDLQLSRIAFFVLIFGGIALLNIRSVKHGVRFIEFATFGKLIPLLVVVFAGMAFISGKNLAWVSSPTLSSLGASSLLLFYAFMGMETPLSNGGEIKNPKRTVPLSIFIGMCFVLILYISIQLVTQGVLGSNISAHKDAPLAGVAGIAFGKAGMAIIILATAISMLGGLGGELLSMPRILFAAARDGLMPKVLAKVHPRFFTPHIAVAVYACAGFLFAIFGGFKQLAVLASASSLLIYLGVVLATIKLRKEKPENAEKTFRVPGGVIVPGLAAIVIVWLLSNLSRQEFVGSAVFIGLLTVVYLVVWYARRRGVWGQAPPLRTARVFREAQVRDIREIQIVRNSVKENMLSDPGLVTDKDCEEYLIDRGKGWVCEVGDQIVGFSIVDLRENNVWALFVRPEFEGLGIGRKLQTIMLDWYFEQSRDTLWLGTAFDTRAEEFYRKSGWTEAGLHGKKEIKFEMTYADWQRVRVGLTHE